MPRLRLLAWLLLAGWVTTAPAGEVRMRSGMVLTGSPRKLQSLTVKNDKQSQVPTFSVVMVETGAAWYFLPSKQIPDGGLNLDSSLATREAFAIKQEKTNPKSQTLASVGQFAEVTPFDDHGRRRVTLNSAKGPVHIVQGITEITPDSIKLTGLTHHWEYGISTKAVPADVLENVLRHRISPENPQLRLQLARFFIQAEMYPQAFKELESLARDFPDLKERATSVHQDLVQEFGRVVLRELKLRVEAGQYQLAEENARQITPDRIGGAVLKDATEFLKTCQNRRDTANTARDLLDELAGSLADEEQRKKLAPIRSVVVEELHPNTLNRLDPFLKAADDDGYTVDEKLALAYSGWILGAANAVTDLAQAIRLWDARFLVQEALRGETTNARTLTYDQLRKVEGVGPEMVRRMIPQLPPVIETPGIVAGVPRRIEVPGSGETPDVSYSVLLPLEYSPHHTYPMVITLRAQGRTPEQMLDWWGGSADDPGLSQRRGYIVIAPEYAPANQGEYDYDSATHLRVLAAMNDARRRFPIDSERIFLSGHGMGGDAAFDLGFSHPDEFAGVIPICGVCDLYAKQYIDNAQGSAWYIVGGELDRDATSRNQAVIDKIIKTHGFRFDLIYCEFPQRGYEHFAEELPRIFDWMSLHRRMPMPKKDFKMKSLRKSDGRFFWLEATNLPRSVVLNAPAGAKGNTKPMWISADIAPGSKNGNDVTVNSPSNKHTLWIHPDLIDLEKRVFIHVNGQRKHNQFIDPDVAATLEDFHTRGDRQRLFVARLEF